MELDSNTVTEEEKQYLKEKYSVDASKIRLIKEDTYNLYYINFILLIIFYSLLLILTVFMYSKIFQSPDYIFKSALLVFLFIYPLVIYPIQSNVYMALKYIWNRIYKNVFFSKDW